MIFYKLESKWTFSYILNQGLDHFLITLEKYSNIF
jgi:hypothetical protein